ncbi:MAG: diguanylate cyclase [Helicobacteraceae bacterium]|nr:diguanylate cyclase [Candidatus Sulfurimonas ponti]
MLHLLKLLFVIYGLLTSLHASSKIEIFTLHSYSQEYPWTKSQHEAFVDTLVLNKNNIQFHSEYLDTKRLNMTQEYQDEFLAYINKKYNDTDIDIIYVTDDNALTFIHNNYKKLFKKEKNTPVFFSGVNNLNMHKQLASDIFKGVYEVKEVKENIELIKQFSPQTRDIYFIGDDSHTYHSIKETIEQEAHTFKNMTFHYISDIYLSKVLAQLPSQNRSFIVLTTIGHFKDEANNTLLVEESIAKIKEKQNIILLTMEDAYMYKGVVGGYVTNGSSQGREAAKLVLKYLQNKSLEDIKSLLKSPNTYIFNSKELVNARVILSEYISRNATIIGKDIDFITKNQSLLLSILALIVIGLIFTIVLIYAFLRKKHYQNSQTPLNEECAHIKSKLNAKDQFINNIMLFDDIAYWRLDTVADELFLSQNLLDILSIDGDIYKNDPNALSYFIHEHDKALFQKNLHMVKEKNTSVNFTHQIISSDKKLFKVKHLIYTQYSEHKPSSLILGIIKFE